MTHHVRIGEKIRIIANNVGHGLGIGEVVNVVDLDSCGHPNRCTNGKKTLYVGKFDYEKIEKGGHQ